jgi:uncharacterized membrane protein
MTLLVLGLVLFLGIHSVSIVAPGARDRWAGAMGPLAWRGVYSLLSIVGFVLLVIGYGQARQAPVVVYAPPSWTRHVTFALMLPVFPMLLAAYLPGRIRSTLKHPMLVAVKTWALAHLLANGMLADVLLFGSLLAWAVFDRISLKHRPQRPIQTAPASPWNDLLAVVLGLGLYVATLLWLHRWVIGMPLV